MPFSRRTDKRADGQPSNFSEALGIFITEGKLIENYIDSQCCIEESVAGLRTFLIGLHRRRFLDSSQQMSMAALSIGQSHVQARTCTVNQMIAGAHGLLRDRL